MKVLLGNECFICEGFIYEGFISNEGIGAPSESEEFSLDRMAPSSDLVRLPPVQGDPESCRVLKTIGFISFFAMTRREAAGDKKSNPSDLAPPLSATIQIDNDPHVVGGFP